jgi:GNAT superfamily N-acetyltransferase
VATFSSIAEEFWRAQRDGATILQDSSGLLIAARSDLADNRRLTVLERTDSATVLLTPALAERLALPSTVSLSLTGFRAALADAGIALHGADAVYYFAEDARPSLLAERAAPGIRMLTPDDREAFALFRAAVSEQDFDDAGVELDHWAVAGGFAGDQLVCASSAYPWGDSLVADIGVLTVPSQRGRGLARLVVRELSRRVLARGLEPQYRTQLDHTASRAVAAGAGLRWFGNWDAIASGA